MYTLWACAIGAVWSETWSMRCGQREVHHVWTLQLIYIPAYSVRKHEGFRSSGYTWFPTICWLERPICDVLFAFLQTKSLLKKFRKISCAPICALTFYTIIWMSYIYTEPPAHPRSLIMNSLFGGIQSTLFIPILDTTTKFVTMTIWLS